MFGQTNSWLRWLTGRKPVVGDDLRVWVRFPDKGKPVERKSSPEDCALVKARIRDFTATGMNLEVDEGFEGGNLILVDLPACAEQPAATVLAYILRADPVPSGGWTLGCAFAEETGPCNIAALISPLPSGEDRRAWARLSIRGSCRYYPIGGYSLTRSADIVNVSPAGVGLAAAERIEPSTILALEMSCMGGPFISAIASVVSVSPFEDGQWLMGCFFDHEMEEDDWRTLWDTSGG